VSETPERDAAADLAVCEAVAAGPRYDQGEWLTRPGFLSAVEFRTMALVALPYWIGEAVRLRERVEELESGLRAIDTCWQHDGQSLAAMARKILAGECL
jgi:hypothetical protein